MISLLFMSLALAEPTEQEDTSSPDPQEESPKQESETSEESKENTPEEKTPEQETTEDNSHNLPCYSRGLIVARGGRIPAAHRAFSPDHMHRDTLGRV